MSALVLRSNRHAFYHFEKSILMWIFRLDFTLAAIYAIIGSTEIAWESPKKWPSRYQNLCVPSALMRESRRSCIVFVGSHMTNPSQYSLKVI